MVIVIVEDVSVLGHLTPNKNELPVLKNLWQSQVYLITVSYCFKF